MVSIWTNKYSQGYGSAKNSIIAKNECICRFVDRIIEDIWINKDVYEHRGVPFSCFLMI